MDVDFSEKTGSPEEVAAEQQEQEKIDKARAELVDENSAPEEELILGKYKSTEDLASAYQNLQREYSKLKGGERSEPEAEAEPEPEATPEPKEEVPALTAEQQQNIDDIMQSVLTQAGGEEKYQQLATWSKNNLPPDRLNAYNKAVESGEKGQIMTALKSLQYDYMMATGYEPRLTGGRAAPESETKGFRSRHEMLTAMGDSRYRDDDAFRRDVERRIAVTDDALFGLKG
jgi:hypothetical protein